MDSKAQDSRFHKQKNPGFCIPQAKISQINFPNLEILVLNVPGGRASGFIVGRGVGR